MRRAFIKAMVRGLGVEVKEGRREDGREVWRRLWLLS
jgi:hypothetical protein